jgi:hypothetical protein
MLTVKKQRPRLLSDLPPDLRKAIEHVQIDARGNVVPQLYSKLQANAELRKLLNIGSQEHRPETDVSRLSDAELIQQLARRVDHRRIRSSIRLRRVRLCSLGRRSGNRAVRDRD